MCRIIVRACPALLLILIHQVFKIGPAGLESVVVGIRDVVGNDVQLRRNLVSPVAAEFSAIIAILCAFVPVSCEPVAQFT